MEMIASDLFLNRVRPRKARCHGAASSLHLFVGLWHILIPSLTCFHASFFPFCPLCWPCLFPPFSGHFSPSSTLSKSALFCREKGTAQILERSSFRVDLSTKVGKEIPSRNLREKGSGLHMGMSSEERRRRDSKRTKPSRGIAAPEVRRLESRDSNHGSLALPCKP